MRPPGRTPGSCGTFEPVWSQQIIAEMRRNYEAIGGRSPLTTLTEAQASALRLRLGAEVPVVVGMRNWKPFIRDALLELRRKGATRVIGVPLAPQFSTLSVAKYYDAAKAALPEGVELCPVPSFHAHPLLVDAFAQRVREAAPFADEEIVFTAHSLPERVVAAGDGYAAEVSTTARLVASGAGVARYHLAFQSAGRTPEPWIGPDVGDLIAELAGHGARRFLIVPIGFVCDHTEILFDIDIQARERARASGASLRRIESLNTSPAFISMLQDVVSPRL